MNELETIILCMLCISSGYIIGYFKGLNRRRIESIVGNLTNLKD